LQLNYNKQVLKDISKNRKREMPLQASAEQAGGGRGISL